MPTKKSKKPKGKDILPVYPVWGLICSFSSIDQVSNNISLSNIIDQFNLPKDTFDKSKELNQPVGIGFNLDIVSVWRRKIDANVDDREFELDVQVSLIDPQNKNLMQLLSKFELKKGININRFKITTNAFFVTIPGNYTYVISMKYPDSEVFQKMIDIPFSVTEKLG